MPSPGGQCHQLKEPGSDFPVIANQSADWCGNPFPLQRPDFEHVTKEKTDCHVAALLAMTEVDGTLVLKLMTLPFGDDFEIIFQAIRFRKQPNKLEFDVIIIRRAYVMTPPTRREFPIGWLNGKGSFIP